MDLTNHKIEHNIIDIMKAIGIILVVLGHSGFLYSSIIYTFQMPLFFIISGYCFKLNSVDNVKGYIIKKIKHLYIPYVLIGTILVLSYNALYRIGFYNNSEQFLQLESGNYYGLIDPYSFKDVIINIAKTLFLFNNEQLIGVNWFVKILFLVEIFNILLRKIIRNNQIVILVLLCLAFVLAHLLTVLPISSPSDVRLFLISFSMFTIGALIKKHTLVINFINCKIVIKVLVSFILLCFFVGSCFFL